MKRAILVAAVVAAGCVSPMHVPESVRVPAGQSLALELKAKGVQIYECAAGEAAGTYEWKFRAPEASLVDAGGKPMGSHYAGPTWKAPDGSVVVAKVRGRAPSSEPGAIPLLLLDAKGDGDGVFGPVRSIQRLDTVGGQAPETGCNATRLAAVARVPYTATYYFYK